MDKAQFYVALKRKDSGVFGTRLSAKQVETIEVILDEATKRDLPLRDTAYVLATTRHEVGSSMQPIRENLNYTSAASIRRTWPSRFKSDAAAKPYVRNPQGLANKVYGGRLGNTDPDDGWNYRGRGFPQTTGKENYERSGKIVGVDLVKEPDRMLEPRIAAITMIESMVRGLYTGKKLSDYLSGSTADYVNARAIINGDVKKNGRAVANYAMAFEKALIEAGYVGAVAVPIDAPIPKPKPEQPAVKLDPVPAPPVVEKDLITKVQELLREKGYPEVGEPDGKFGTRTRNAILAFEADNGLPLTGTVSDELLVALIKAQMRQNSEVRETTTAKDLKNKEGVKLGDWLKKIAIGVLGASGLGGITEGSASFDQITNGVTDAKEMLAAFGPLAKWLVGIGLGLVVYHFASRFVKAQVRAYQEGRLL